MYKINILDLVVNGQSIRLTYFFYYNYYTFPTRNFFPIRLDISKSSNRMKKKTCHSESIVDRNVNRVVQGLHLNPIGALYI